MINPYVIFVHTLLPAPRFEGRPELDSLCEWWRNRKGGVISLSGIGGAGKTALVDGFLRLIPNLLPSHQNDFQKQELDIPSHLFVFSFYAEPNETIFFKTFYAFIFRTSVDNVPSSFSQIIFDLQTRGVSPTDRVLLVLDGIEAVQESKKGHQFGRLRDDDLKAFLIRVASGLLPTVAVIITTRFPIPELENKQLSTHTLVKVDKMPATALVKVLKNAGVSGNDDTLEKIVNDCGHHALTTDIVARYISVFHNGNPNGRFDLFTEEDLEESISKESDDTKIEVLKLEKKLLQIGKRYRQILKDTDDLLLMLLDCICFSYREVSISSILSRLELSTKNPLALWHHSIPEILPVEKRLVESRIQSKMMEYSADLKYNKNKDIDNSVKKYKSDLLKDHGDSLSSAELELILEKYKDDLERDKSTADLISLDKFQKVLKARTPSEILEKDDLNTLNPIIMQHIRKKCSWLSSLGLVQEPIADKYCAHIAIRAPFIQNMSPELEKLAHHAAIRATQLELPEDYRKEEPQIMATHFLKEKLCCRNVVFSNDINVLISLSEIVQHLFDLHDANTAFNFYLYVMGGFEHLSKSMITLKLGFETIGRANADELSDANRPRFFYEFSKYLEEMGALSKAYDYYSISIELFQKEHNQYGASEASCKLVEVLLRHDSLEAAINAFDACRRMMNTNVFDYITEDHRTYRSGPTAKIGELSHLLDFLRSGVFNCATVWNFYGPEWCLCALRAGHIKEAHQLCEIELSKIQSSCMRPDSTHVIMWKLVFAECLRCQGLLDTLNNLLELESTIMNANCCYPKLILHLLLGRCFISKSKKLIGTEFNHKVNDLLSAALRELTSGLHLAASYEYNALCLDFLIEIAHIKLFRKDYAAAAYCALLCLDGPSSSEKCLSFSPPVLQLKDIVYLFRASIPVHGNSQSRVYSISIWLEALARQIIGESIMLYLCEQHNTDVIEKSSMPHNLFNIGKVQLTNSMEIKSVIHDPLCLDPKMWHREVFSRHYSDFYQYSNKLAHGETISGIHPHRPDATDEHIHSLRSQEGVKMQLESDGTKRWRALLVCVTSTERLAIRTAINNKGINITEDLKQGEFLDTFFWPDNSKSWEVCLFRAVDQRGEEAARLVTQLTTLSKYDVVFMIGICMGITGRINRGDVLVPREVFSIAHRRDTAVGEKGIPHPLSPPTASIKRMQSILDSSPRFRAQVHLKQSVCGPWKLEDPDSERLKEVIAFSPDVYGYEMEAEGFFRSVQEKGFDALLVKGVSDFADAPGGSSSGSSQKKKEQITATQNALEIILAWLDHYSKVPPYPG